MHWFDAGGALMMASVERNLIEQEISMNELNILVRVAQGLLAVAMVIASGVLVQVTMPLQ